MALDNSASGDFGARDEVELRLPADGAYASVLRTTAAGLAARLDLTLDDIEDLRVAIGEASALVLPAASVGSDLRCTFGLAPDRLSVSIRVETGRVFEIDRDSFTWQVLTTMATEVEVDATSDSFTVQLTMVSSAS